MSFKLHNNEPLIIRADAGPRIGTGHVMRCLALAQAWQDMGGQVSFIMATSVPTLNRRLAGERMVITNIAAKPGSGEDVEKTLTIAKNSGAKWLVVDGYDFDGNYQMKVKNAGLKLMVVDDYGHADHYFADIILNQNLSANEALYEKREPYTKLLLGPRYALLRREFLKYSNWERKLPEKVKKVLVTLGGADPDNVTEKAITALSKITDIELEVVVVAGGANSHFQKLRSVAEQSIHKISLKQNVANMPELMAWADIAISGGGSTCWELAFMGLPALVIILAKNQEDISLSLDESGVAVNLGWFNKLSSKVVVKELSFVKDAKRRELMSSKARQLVDGLGSKRILDYLSVGVVKV